MMIEQSKATLILEAVLRVVLFIMHHPRNMTSDQYIHVSSCKTGNGKIDHCLVVKASSSVRTWPMHMHASRSL